MNVKTYRIYCISKAASPISHMARTEDNEAIINRMEVMTPKGRRQIPSLTGNMLRSVCVRMPGASLLKSAYGMHGAINKRLANFLDHGGTMSQGGSRVDPARTAEMYRLFPLLRLLAGCLPDEIARGNTNSEFGMLVCRENLGWLDAYVPPVVIDALSPAFRPAEDFVGSYTYYRRSVNETDPNFAAATSGKVEIRLGDTEDDGWLAKHADALGDVALLNRTTKPVLYMSESAAEALWQWYKKQKDAKKRLAFINLPEDNRGIFSGGYVTPGAVFVHRFVLRDVTPVEVGCLLCSIGRWQDGGGYVGGMQARGHGRLQTSVYSDDFAPDDVPDLMRLYGDYAEGIRDEAMAWINKVFEPKPPAEKAGKGKKAKQPALVGEAGE